jgi:hypothetical protein
MSKQNKCGTCLLSQNKNLLDSFGFKQGTMTEGEGSAQLTWSILYKAFLSVIYECS